MSGRKPIKLYEYTEEGVYVRSYNTGTEYREVNFPDDIGKRPITPFNRLGVIFGKTLTGNYIFRHRYYRDKVKYLHTVYMSEYCSELITNTRRPIQVFNLEGTLLMEARNLTVLCKLIDVSQPTIIKQLKSNLGPRTRKLVSCGLLFKYKEEESDL